jgi:hypothetical protein
MKYTIPIYESVLYIVVAEDCAAAKAKLPKSLHSEMAGLEKDGVYGGSCSLDGEFAICFFTRYGPVTANTVFHEAGHTAFDILSWHNVPITVENQEAFTYLLGWLGELLMKAISKKKRKG